MQQQEEGIQKQKSQAVGSVWNPNSWHWEQKNYSEKVKDILLHKLNQIELSSSTAKLTFTKISPKGEAELMIRKGKQAIIYDFEIEVEFRGENSQNEVEGSFKIIDINQSDMDFEILDIKVNKTDYNILAHDSKELVRVNLKPLLIKSLSTLVQELQSYEEQKVEQLKNERELQNQEIQRLRSENKEFQEKLLQEQKEKEYQEKIKNNMPK